MVAYNIRIAKTTSMKSVLGGDAWSCVYFFPLCLLIQAAGNCAKDQKQKQPHLNGIRFFIHDPICSYFDLFVYVRFQNTVVDIYEKGNNTLIILDLQISSNICLSRKVIINHCKMYLVFYSEITDSKWRFHSPWPIILTECSKIMFIDW